MWVWLTRNGLVNIPYTPETLYVSEEAWPLISIDPHQTFKVIPTPRRAYPENYVSEVDIERDVTEETQHHVDVLEHQRD